MNVRIKPSVLSGTIKAPASKSMAHRLLICAAFCDGESEISNISYSEDILATIDCLEALGAQIKKFPDRVNVRGVKPENFRSGIFPCRESGSTLRFFIPLAMLSEEKSVFTGYGRLMERPMEIYEKIAEDNNLLYDKSEGRIVVSGKLPSGDYYVRGDISSQFITGLMFALSLKKEDSRIILTGKAESLSYLDLTIESMRKFGVSIEKCNETEFYIKGSQKYKPQKLSVEGDYSNAAFSDAFALIGNSITVSGLSDESAQGDRIYKKYFSLLKNGNPVLDVSDCPDLAPVLMTLACMLNGAELTGTRRLKLKESDRGEVMKEELSKFGADIVVNENSIIISAAELYPPCELLSGHNDHRVVMSLSVICSVYGGRIEGSEAVRKSYPDFFQVMKKSGLEVTEYGDK